MRSEGFGFSREGEDEDEDALVLALAPTPVGGVPAPSLLRLPGSGVVDGLSVCTLPANGASRPIVLIAPPANRQ